MKLIVLNKAMFELQDETLSIKDLTAFLTKKGFLDIDDWHLDNDYAICTAEFIGKNRFQMPDIEIPEFYLHRIKTKKMDFLNRTAYNANQLNEICARNGYEH